MSFFTIPAMLWLAFIKQANIHRIKNELLQGVGQGCLGTHLKASDIWLLLAFILLGPALEVGVVLALAVILPWRMFDGLKRLKDESLNNVLVRPSLLCRVHVPRPPLRLDILGL